ncbi:hypothetical protein BT93_C2019 [Corymbia citriodora subsp. variegata]|nr:hypothetical protein BT93_C2019 [Corymbia citriodora subsp. variegata]
MTPQRRQIQGNMIPMEPPPDFQVSFGSEPSQLGGAPGIPERVVDGHYYRPLLQAAVKGDWESAKRFFEDDTASKTAIITSRSETVLHIAAGNAQDQFVENLVELLSPYPKALEMVDCDGRTALHNAVLSARITIVEALVRRNPNLTQLADDEGRVPFHLSTLEASMHKEIVWFLAKNTTDDEPGHPFSSPLAIEAIIDLTFAGHHGIPVDLNFKSTDGNPNTAFQNLTKSLWNAAKIVVPIIKRTHEAKLRNVAATELAKQVCIAISYMKTTEIAQFINDDMMFDATTKGISELVKLFIQFYPEIIGISPFDKRLTTHAVLFRQERTLRLFLKVSSTNELSLVPAPTREESRDLMKAAAQYDPNFDALSNVSGAAFQMQREVQWYKAVEGWIVPNERTAKNDDETPFWKLFVKNHEKLLENGEKWVKDTANSCMLVSTLIAAVLFTAAFTVPGGNDNDNGVPLLLGEDSLLVFAISDGLGLFSSVTAILLFLAILTSRYEPQDFLDMLPKKIIMGLCFLFLSLAFMLVAFATTLTIVLGKRVEWVLIPITSLACIPVALFVVLQLPLLFQMVKSTYGPSIFRAESIWK